MGNEPPPGGVINLLETSSVATTLMGVSPHARMPARQQHFTYELLYVQCPAISAVKSIAENLAC